MMSGPEMMDAYIAELKKVERAEKPKETGKWKTLRIIGGTFYYRCYSKVGPTIHSSLGRKSIASKKRRRF